MSTVLSIRIPVELKENLEKYNIGTEDIRVSLERIVELKRREEAYEKLMKYRATLPKLDRDYSTNIIREMRDREWPES